MDASFIEVLLVEDNRADVDLTKECLNNSKLLIKLNVVDDGVKAMQYLRRQEPYASTLRPDLVLLDLNLPKKDGREVLNEMKKDDELKLIPVVILTTSNSDQDILASYGLGANCYVTKPIGLEQFTKVVKTIETFWFTVVKLPPRV